MKNTTVLLYALAGLVAGVGIGMLLAPAAGNDTRERLMSSAGKWSKKLGLKGEEEFPDSELEMDATNGRSYGF